MSGSKRFLLSWWLAWAGAIAILVSSSAALLAADDYERFLEGLRDRGYFDVTLEYLARLRTDPRIPDDFKSRISYEEGTTLIAAAVADRDADQKSRFLNLARDKLGEFIKGTSDEGLKADAESQLGNVLVERAKMLLHRAGLPKFAAQKATLTEEARRLFTEAQQVFTSSEQKFDAHFKQLPKPGEKQTSSQTEARQEARISLLRARLFAAQALYESSKAYPADSGERKKLLEAAAVKFGELREKHRSALAGMLATTSQGRCYLDLGDTKRGAWRIHRDSFPTRRRQRSRAIAPAQDAHVEPGHASLDQRHREELRDRGAKGPGAGRQAHPRRRHAHGRLAGDSLLYGASRSRSTPQRLATRRAIGRSRNYATCASKPRRPLPSRAIIKTTPSDCTRSWPASPKVMRSRRRISPKPTSVPKTSWKSCRPSWRKSRSQLR